MKALEEKKRKYYQIGEWLPSKGKEILAEYCRQFQEGARTIPIVKTINQLNPKKNVHFTLTLDLIEKIVSGDQKIVKSFEDAAKFGLRGYSRGEQNGIFPLRPYPHDQKMRDTTEALVRKQWPEIVQDLNLAGRPAEEMIPRLTFVKIVHHDPSGKRVVGVMYKDRIVFVGVASY